MPAGANGPAVLVLTILFSEDRILLQRRGHEPYAGKWATPGGYVEAGESLEAAAVREIKEEVGIEISEEQLLPHGILSLPALNQICIVFLAYLDKPTAPTATPPEVLDAKWFSEAEMTQADLWPPGASFDLHRVFDRARARRLEIYQQATRFLRLVSTGCETTYLRYIGTSHDPHRKT